jgi:branched-subunit amino acid transport protein AzlD
MLEPTAYTVRMARVLPVLVLLALAIYCAVDVAQSDRFEVRTLPKWLWVALIILIPGVGPVLWLALGRPTASSRREPETDLPPDDNPEFLRRL